MSICEQKGSEIFTRSHRNNNDSDDTSCKNITLSENVSGSDIKMMAALSTVTLLRGKGARAQLKRARQGCRGEREGQRGLEGLVNITNT